MRAAADLGFDQICVYPLVLRADLDAAWASDPDLLADGKTVGYVPQEPKLLMEVTPRILSWFERYPSRR